MNKQEYLLNQLSQECIEVAKEISKALAFGLEDYDPREPIITRNKDRIESELNDLLGTIKFLIKNKILDEHHISHPTDMMLKELKIKKWMKRARKVGGLK